jgi:hypothetical protein
MLQVPQCGLGLNAEGGPLLQCVTEGTYKASFYLLTYPIVTVNSFVWEISVKITIQNCSLHVCIERVLRKWDDDVSRFIFTTS